MKPARRVEKLKPYLFVEISKQIAEKRAKGEEIISFAKAIEPVFGSVNIEDIESPKVLDIIERLKNELSKTNALNLSIL